MPRIDIMISLLGLPVIGPAAFAACFCLIHPSGTILNGCEAKGDEYICSDPENHGKKSIQKITSAWKRIDCGPFCFVVEHPKIEMPRGGDDQTKQGQ